MSETGRLPRVAAVVVNWNTSESAIAAASKIGSSQGVDVTVVIVDNNSTRDQRDRLRRQANGKYALLESPENLGFGSAANLGLRGSEADFILVSNADVSPDRHAVAELVAAAQAKINPGMVGPVFNDDVHGYHVELPGPATLLGRILVGRLGHREPAMPGPGETREIGQPAGAFFLMTKEIWAEMNGFDEGFFLWYEDVDLAKRLKDTGRQGLVVGDAKVEHVGGKSFVRLDPQTKQAIRLDSLDRYLRLHHPVTRILARPVFWLSRRLRAGPTSSMRQPHQKSSF